MPSDMDHLHGTDTRNAQFAELRAENEALNYAKGQDGAVVVAPAGDSPLRELYESPEFRAAWANREEK